MINEEPLTRPSVALNGLLCLPGCPGVCGTHDLASVKTLSGCHRSPRAFTAAELSTISHTAGSGLNSAVLDLAPNSFKILFETRGHPLTFSGCKLFGDLAPILFYPSRSIFPPAVYCIRQLLLFGSQSAVSAWSNLGFEAVAESRWLLVDALRESSSLRWASQRLDVEHNPRILDASISKQLVDVKVAPTRLHRLLGS
ncbi:hypothetical protein C8F04DRAFT_1180613 [Mycena alexandri]|uniref:Uncharacterized protein n=1 Tax=Mycena alexandri TaxID=1745969 RepID=A0AAD6T0P8_9AGAR|nr:hypothetical protein C8F04DRAFT_1180613 [Mycena alexandri]